MFFFRNRFVSETFRVVRPIGVFLVAAAIIGSAMAAKGWTPVSWELAGMIVLMGVLVVLEVYRGVSDFHQRSTTIAEAAAHAERHYLDVLRRVVRFVEARDQYRRGHSQRVGDLSERLARQLGFPKEKCALFNLCGQLHDLGLLAIPARVLGEPGRMGVGNFRSVQKHPRITYEILKPLKSLEDVLPAILHHHERMNGTGYPRGMQGEEISIEGRVLAVADAYDAMTHDRPNRAAMSPFAAMAELHRCSPSGYDPKCVSAFAEMMGFPVAQETTVAAVGV